MKQVEEDKLVTSSCQERDHDVVIMISSSAASYHITTSNNPSRRNKLISFIWEFLFLTIRTEQAEKPKMRSFILNSAQIKTHCGPIFCHVNYIG